ncbi:MAG TPA: hypothetical protein VGC66_00710 [Pyrinomonadaceae bacterium]|jgi:hypothetical protein
MAIRVEYTLEIIDGYMRPLFEGKEQEWNELMWDLLLPFPVSVAAIVEDIKLVEAGELDEWSFESPLSKITCTPKNIVVEEKLKKKHGRKPIKIKLRLREAMLLLERWLFECVWREQQAREQSQRHFLRMKEADNELERLLADR